MRRLKKSLHNLSHDPQKIIMVGALSLTILIITIISILVALIINVNYNEGSKAKLPNETDITELSNFIKFSDAQIINYKYQSAVFDFEVDINTKDYKYTENATGINIFNSDFTQQGAIVVTTVKPGQTLALIDQTFANDHKYLRNFKLLQSSDVVIDQSPAKVEYYSYQNYSGTVVFALSAFTIHDKFLYEFKYTNYVASALQGNELDLVLRNFKFIDSSRINASANYQSSLWGYEFNYDAKYWILNKSDYTATLTQRAADLSQDQPIASIEIYSQEILRSELKDNEETYLVNKANTRKTQIENKALDGLRITDIRDEKLGNRNVKIIEYKDIEKKGGPYFYREYLILHYNTFTSITIYPVAASDNMKAETDEMLASLKFNEPSQGVVKGLDNSAKNDERAAILTKPAVVQIFFQRCGTVKIPTTANLPITSGKTYNLCAAATGSGFFINSEGYVATNGHVVSMSKNDFQSNAYNLQLLINLFKDLYLPSLKTTNPTKYNNLSDSQILSLLKSQTTMLYDLLDANKELLSATYNQMKITDSIYVQKSTNSFELADLTSQLENISKHLEAKLIDLDFDAAALSNEKEKASDVAILKVEKGDYPTLTLGDNQYTIEGSQVIAVGFPGAANALSFINKELETQETFTKGLISRIITTTGDRRLLQIDASVNQGNSGGPLINVEDTKVLGLVTYITISGSSDFNYARDIADLKKLMDKNNISNKIGTTQNDINTGVNYFFEGKYSKSVNSLKAAKTNYPDLEGVDKIISLANDKIAQGLDYQEPVKNDDPLSFFNDLQSTEKVLFGIVGCLICVVLILAFAILMILGKLRKRNNFVSQPNTPLPVT